MKRILTMSIMKAVRTRAARLLGWGLAGFALSGAGSAVASTWTFNNSDTNSQNGITATATAWANTLGSANVQLASAYLGYNGGSGLGIQHADSESTTSPQDAVDNDARTESFLFSFDGDKVNLTSSYFGWIARDSDFSVYAYTGADAGSLNDLTYSDLTNQGWTLVGHYSEASQSGNEGENKEFPNVIFSSYWLIGAYNGTNADSTNDYFKLKSVSGLACSASPGCGGSARVPEPGTLLLVALGLLALFPLMHRRAAN